MINELKSEKNKDTMERFDYDKILKMKYRELYELYLKSNEFKQYKQKMYDLYEKKGNSEKEKIDIWFNNFIERFKKKNKLILISKELYFVQILIFYI